MTWSPVMMIGTTKKWNGAKICCSRCEVDPTDLLLIKIDLF